MMKVLLVEDSPVHAMLIQRALTQQCPGVQIEHVNDGESALNRLGDQHSDNSTPPDLVLLDLRLPLIDGLDVLAELRHRKPTRNTPVVMISSCDDDEYINCAYGSGANAYCVKPDDAQRFMAQFKSVGDFWLRRATLPDHHQNHDDENSQ